MKAWTFVALIVVFLLSSCSDDTDVPQPDTVAVDAGPMDGPPAGDGTADALPPDASTPDAALGCEDLSDQRSDYANYQVLLACLRDSTAADADKEQAIDDFVKIVEASGGFPIVEGDKVVFVYVRKAEYDVDDDKQTEENFSISSRKEPIRVSGNFNGWALSQYPLTHEGNELFHTEIQLDASGKERYNYRFLATNDAAEDVWFSDPLSRRYDFDSDGRVSLIRGGNDSSGKAIGHLEHFRSVHATQLNNDRPIYLYVPRNYDHEPTKTYPVFYMHDGYWLFDANQLYSPAISCDVDGVLNKEISGGHVQELIVVAIPYVERTNEYTHTLDKTVSGTGTEGGKGKEYLDFIVNDLKPLVDARYRTKPGKDSTAIIGMSLGGLISYYAGVQHPTVFKYIGGMSSSFWWGEALKNPTMERIYEMDPNLTSYQQVYYLDSGDAAGNPNPPSCLPGTPDEDNYCVTVAFKDMLVKKGINIFPDDPNSFPLTPANINIYYHHQPNAPHACVAWNARMYRPLRLFFPR